MGSVTIINPIWKTMSVCIGLPRWHSGKESACQGDERDAGLIPGLGRSPGIRNGNLLQYSCLGNPMDRGAWLVIIHGVTKIQT